MYELKNLGYSVHACDAFHDGKLTKFYQFLKSLKLKWLPIVSVLKIIKCDVLVIKDDFYTLAALVARIFGKKVIYKDSIFMLPRSKYRRFQASINLMLAHQIVAYSKAQIELWVNKYPQYKNKFEFIFYPIDIAFYSRGAITGVPRENSIISVGRDVGRDNETLVKACSSADVSLELITLPYLLSDKIKGQAGVKIHQYLPYETLFDIYSKSICSVVPLKKNIIYPSGIRAIMEAVALGVPVISARTPVLLEYFSESAEILYYDAEDHQDLSKQINELKSVSLKSNEMILNARKRLEEYSIENYVNEFIKIMGRGMK